MTDESAARADALVSAFILRSFLERTREDMESRLRWRCQRSSDDDARHLVDCPTVRVVDQEGSDGEYGCDTGCEYARLEATITCEHGRSADFEYGDFGDLAGLISGIVDEESRRP
ncbi:hypothetical protein [Streptomyces atriruber]|uniref:hypothetical protein n=1 Tax=Streptomyces atriruber TaxID=545121 RepID=UPI000AE18B54|nr:hypothetical protein [Streptomyces atriruber]